MENPKTILKINNYKDKVPSSERCPFFHKCALNVAWGCLSQVCFNSNFKGDCVLK
jgi:hypothetical protein